MAFQFTNFAQMTPQGNPGMRDLISSLTQGYKSARVPYELEQAEKAQQLQNAMQSLLVEEQPKKFESDQLTAHLAQVLSGLKNQEEPTRFGAETNLSNAQATNFGATTGKTRADTQETLLKNAQAQAFMNMLRSYSQGNSAGQGAPTQAPVQSPALGYSNVGQGAGQSAAPPASQGAPIMAPQGLPAERGSNVPAMPDVRPVDNTVVAAQGNPAASWLNDAYDQNPLFAKQFKDMGVEQKSDVSINPETGQAFKTVTKPNGRVEITPLEVGRRPEDIDRAKKMTEADVGVYKSALDAIPEIEAQQDNLETLNSLLAKNDNLKDVVGPINSLKTRFAGTDQEKALLGSIASSTGNLMLNMGKQIKGSFTKSNQAFVNRTKASGDDQFPIFKAKVATQTKMNMLTRKRIGLIADYIHDGMNPSEAAYKARSETPTDSIEKEYDNKMKGLMLSQEIRNRNYKVTDPDIIKTAKESGKTEQQVIDIIRKANESK